MTLKELVDANRDEILRLTQKHGARNLRVFGSLARGEATAESDIDLLVERAENHSRFFPGGLIADLEALLGCRVHVVTEKALHHLMRDQVLREAVAL